MVQVTRLPFARFEGRATDYPMTVVFMNAVTRAELWRLVIEGPGTFYVPPLKGMFGCRVAVRLIAANGQETVTEPAD